MKKLIIGISVVLLWSCTNSPQPSVVTFDVREGVATLYVDGEEWETRAVSGFDFLDMAQEAGVNTLRTWGLLNLDNGRLLDEAQKRGMKVLVGLWLAHQDQGIDYTSPADSTKIIEQYKRITGAILEYKDHPAVLAWGVANEINARNAPPEVWKAVNDIAVFIKEHDRNHPTVTVLAGSKPEHIRSVKELAPSIDILGINSYLDTKKVRDDIKSAGWNNPFMVTEVGPDGFWESDTTLWGVPVEVNSSVAAQMYTERYTMVDADPLCIGVFPFKWGSVPKKTPTWLSIFLSDSCKTASYDALYYIWNNSYPANRAPVVNNLTINGRNAMDAPVLKSGESIPAAVEATDPDGDELSYHWEVLPEITLTPGIQGTQKITVSPLEGLLTSGNAGNVTLSCPDKPGAYRLYVYVYDGNKSCGYANLPFLVR